MKIKTVLAILIILVIVVIYSLLCYNIFIGLWNATALQGFSGLMIMFFAGILVSRVCVDIYEYFKQI